VDNAAEKLFLHFSNRYLLLKFSAPHQPLWEATENIMRPKHCPNHAKKYSPILFNEYNRIGIGLDAVSSRLLVSFPREVIFVATASVEP